MTEQAGSEESVEEKIIRRVEKARLTYEEMMRKATPAETGGGNLPAIIEPEQEVSLQVEAVRLYAKHGSLAAVGRILGISTYELSKMSGEAGWKEELGAIKRADQAALDARLTKILGNTLEHLEDRLEHGDKKIVDGQIQFAPISAIMLAKIVDVIFDKRQIVRELPTNYNGETYKLQELAEKLEKLGEAQKMRTIDEVK